MLASLITEEGKDYCMFLFTIISYSYGAGVVPLISFTPSSFSKLSRNPLCSFLYEDSSVPPDQWEVRPLPPLLLLTFLFHYRLICILMVTEL